MIENTAYTLLEFEQSNDRHWGGKYDPFGPTTEVHNEPWYFCILHALQEAQSS
jgi:hypothetical protein